MTNSNNQQSGQNFLSELEMGTSTGTIYCDDGGQISSGQQSSMLLNSYIEPVLLNNDSDNTMSGFSSSQSGLPDLDGSIDRDIIMPWHNMPQMPSPEPIIWTDNDYHNHLPFKAVVEEFDGLILISTYNFEKSEEHLKEIQRRIGWTEELIFDEFDRAINNLDKRILWSETENSTE